MASNFKLRRRLQKITDNTPVYQQQRLISKLASTCTHSIRRLEDAQVERWNCFAYAFDLVVSDTYQRIAWADRRGGNNIFFASAEYARFLMQSEALVEIEEGEAQAGHVVIYLNKEGNWRHAGKIVSRDKRVRSVWGIGHFWEHELWEVPESYGYTVSFYDEVATTDAERVFLLFCKSKNNWGEFADRFKLRDLC